MSDSAGGLQIPPTNTIRITPSGDSGDSFSSSNSGSLATPNSSNFGLPTDSNSNTFSSNSPTVGLTDLPEITAPADALEQAAQAAEQALNNLDLSVEETESPSLSNSSEIENSALNTNLNSDLPTDSSSLNSVDINQPPSATASTNISPLGTSIINANDLSGSPISQNNILNPLAGEPSLVSPPNNLPPANLDIVSPAPQQANNLTTQEADKTQIPSTINSTAVLPTNSSVDQTLTPNLTGAPQQFANLLDVLVANQELPQSTAEKLMVDHISTGESLEDLLTKDNLISETALTQAKATLNNIPYIDLSTVGIFPEAINKLPEGIARTHKMLPFRLDMSDGTLSVAMINPLDLSAIDFVQQKIGLRVLAHYAIPSEVERLLAEYYSQSLSTEVTEALEQTQSVADKKKKVDYSSLSKETIRQAPITKIVETTLTFAIKARASDVHIEPLEEHTRIRYRIDGILTEKLVLPRSVHEAVVSRIKILSGLKIDEKRIPQDGRFNFSAVDQEVDLRVSTLPTIHGEKIVMRLLKKDQKVPSLPELGLNGLALRNVQDAIKVPHGIILITGPTGSGKTTTLYSILHVINSPKVNIMTLEDPVEYQMTGVNQVQINPQAGLTFASGLRSFLRQDPNIIMVGEIRDSETAELAIQASLTGHLVFSTLHTSSAAGAIPRLMDMGAEPFLLASSMTLVMGQRVMRLIHKDYKEEYVPEPAVIEDMKSVLGDKLDMWCRQKGITPEQIKLTRPSKNRPPTEPEYKGRIAIFEVMKMSETISQMVLTRQPASEMEKAAIKDGMLLMKQDGYLKVLEGLTTIEEVLRVAQI